MPYTNEPQSVLTAIDSTKEPYRIYLLTGEDTLWLFGVRHGSSDDF